MVAIYCKFLSAIFMLMHMCVFLYLTIILSYIVPPGYDQGYPPQQPGYPPQQPGYPPQQPGYPPQGYPPQGYPPQGYAPAPAAQQQSSTNVVVVGGGAPAQHTTIIQRPRERVNHVLHLLITIFLFPPWIFVWIILCAIYGC